MSETPVARRTLPEGPEAAFSQRTLRWPLLEMTGVVDAVVTTRYGGCSTGAYRSMNLGLHVGDDPSRVHQNRRDAASAIKLRLADLVFAQQTHGNRVARVGSSDRGRGTTDPADAVADVDALVTTEPNVGLVMMVADCVPLVLVDPVARVLACVHAGWRGTTTGVVDASLDAMVELGAVIPRIVVGLGPAVSAIRYQVGPEVAEAVEATFEDSTGLLLDDGKSRWRLDLLAANRRTLERRGIAATHIQTLGTSTDSGDFFSDRTTRPCGRFALLARLRDDDEVAR